MNSSTIMHRLARGFVALLIPLSVMSLTSSPARAQINPPCGITVRLFNPNTTSSSGLLCSQAHAATFSGTYHATAKANNDTADGGTCYDAGANSGTNTCRVKYQTPDNYKDACTALSQYPVTEGYYSPVAADPSKVVDVPLHWAAGGVLEGTGVITGDPQKTYKMHIQIVDMCGDSATALPGDLQGLPGVDAGLRNLRKTYQFTGYIDIA